MKYLFLSLTGELQRYTPTRRKLHTASLCNLPSLGGKRESVRRQSHKVIAACKEISALAAEPVKALVSYYTYNKKRMRYREFREAGYLIGSGTVESACKQVVTQRLKRAVAR